MAELTRPFPPGTIRSSSSAADPAASRSRTRCARQGVRHAVLSADPSPGGMFRRWPFFQRLLSWTKPHAPVARGTRAYERYDWNSLLGEEAGDPRRSQPTLMDGTLVLPVAPGDGGEPRRVRGAGRARGPLRLRAGPRRGCSTARTARTGSSVETTDGDVHAAATLVMAVGVAEPYTPPGLGMEHAYHYADVRPAETYAGRRVLIIGKQNSGFELANGLLPWARQLVLVSPSHAKLSVDTNSLVGVRARYVQPYEDNVLGGGVSILDAAIDRVERQRRRRAGRRACAGPTAAATSSSRSTTSSRRPGSSRRCCDLPASAWRRSGPARLPVVTPVVGERDRARDLLRRARSARRRRGCSATACRRTPGRSTGRATTPGSWPATSRGRGSASSRRGRRSTAPHAVGWLATELAEAPELFHQRGYLARLLTADPDGGLARRRRPAAGPRPRRRRPGRGRDHPRGRRQRRDLPGPVHAARRHRQRADDRAGPARAGTTRRDARRRR